ncbi:MULTISPECIES: hypothetical protein [unclassified Streptomyces]|uniref:hypothetical protein n=1 Tax=unclassified Streptomyces TaxID=2593676 RepID=UPI00114D3780|nr:MULTISPECIES: hypothetical protein [unclassified Streptomyces]MYR95450.1 hypothetical protein [Streptomyces sp. SID4937]
MGDLPKDDLAMRKILLAESDYGVIAARFGVSRQAVSYRALNLHMHSRGPKVEALAVLPWDVSNHPHRAEVIRDSIFRGLRRMVAVRLREREPDRYAKAFVRHVVEGDVAHLEPDSKRLIYVRRLPSDGGLVVRWPEGSAPPSPTQLQLLVCPEGEEVSAFLA